MKNIFQGENFRRPLSSNFDLTHQRKFSFNPGSCIPTLCQEVLPSEKWDYRTSGLVRFQPLLSPIMHMVDVCSYGFFVPSRLTMGRSKFETFITGGNKGDGKDANGVTVEIPYCTFNLEAGDVVANSSAASIWGGVLYGGDQGTSLADYLGVNFEPLVSDDVLTFRLNMMPFIAYWRIYNEYFRDQNLMPDFVELYPNIFESSGNITAAIYAAMTNATPFKVFDFWTVPNVCWEKDYFTSMLPTAQRGAPVETPLSGTASWTYTYPATARKTGGLNPAPAGDIKAASMVPGTPASIYNSSTEPITIENIDEIELDSGGFTISDLRLAARLQEFLEKMSRGGARYIEQIKIMFGVTSSDARLQRPEYLYGGKIPVNISEVLQTSENAGGPLGDMAGHGVAAGNMDSFSRSFEEHGILICVWFLRPKTAYMQGTPRLFTQRFDRLDWPWPQFANIGEQEVKTSEIWMTGFPAEDDITMGYQQRYAECKYIPSTCHGEFKTTLDFWHWARKFTSIPTLSPEFVKCIPDGRIFNVIGSSNTLLYAIVNNKITARRPLPYHASPTL